MDPETFLMLRNAEHIAAACLALRLDMRRMSKDHDYPQHWIRLVGLANAGTMGLFCSYAVDVYQEILAVNALLAWVERMRTAKGARR